MWLKSEIWKYIINSNITNVHFFSLFKLFNLHVIKEFYIHIHIQIQIIFKNKDAGIRKQIKCSLSKIMKIRI